jgi:NADP-dependent 3-hydroxy acid dehydrogenase YdfG
MRKISFITGVTSGIGEAVAIALAADGYDLIITGRRNERLELLKSEIEEKYKVNILPLCFDVRDKETVEKSIENLPDVWKNIDVLINNAGLAVGLNHIQDGIIDDWERMIDTNVKGLLYVTRAVSPLMIKRNKGHIINISSIAGKEVYEKGNVYCATKHAVDALSKAMRIDMLEHNIKVTNIGPGAAATEFSLVRFKDDKERAADVYKGFMPLSADDIANVIRFAVSLPAHVCINDLVITCTAQATAISIKKT